jgi:hypothetical protein
MEVYFTFCSRHVDSKQDMISGPFHTAAYRAADKNIHHYQEVVETEIWLRQFHPIQFHPLEGRQKREWGECKCKIKVQVKLSLCLTKHHICRKKKQTELQV